MSARRHYPEHPDLASNDTAQTVGDGLNAFLEKSGVSFMMKHPELRATWNEIAGSEMAAHTQPSSLRNGVLEILVDSSSVLHEVQFNRHTLLKVLRQRIKQPFISRLTFAVKRI
jgi:predicted nucleic acid-binding Zn ribbon protein